MPKIFFSLKYYFILWPQNHFYKKSYLVPYSINLRFTSHSNVKSIKKVLNDKEIVKYKDIKYDNNYFHEKDKYLEKEIDVDNKIIIKI